MGELRDTQRDMRQSEQHEEKISLENDGLTTKEIRKRREMIEVRWRECVKWFKTSKSGGDETEKNERMMKKTQKCK